MNENLKIHCENFPATNNPGLQIHRKPEFVFLADSSTTSDRLEKSFCINSPVDQRPWFCKIETENILVIYSLSRDTWVKKKKTHRPPITPSQVAIIRTHSF